MCEADGFLKRSRHSRCSPRSGNGESAAAPARTARCRGLLAGEDDFEPHFLEALDRHEQTGRLFRPARTALQVAQGKTNREVGAALFLSPKTVEFHLGRVYRKLDIRSRGELIRRFATDAALESVAADTRVQSARG
jgi:DNA-binding NarL/FixJ family response regulator